MHTCRLKELPEDSIFGNMGHRIAGKLGFAVSKDSAYQLCCRWNNELISLFNAYKVIRV